MWSVRACVGARAGCRATAVAAMSILGIRGPSTSSCDVSASADLTGTRGYAVQGSRGRAGGRNEPSSAAERARSAGTATSRLRYSALIWRMCGRLAAHEVCYEPKPPGVHEPRPIRDSGGLRGHQMDDDRMTAHSPDGGFKQSRRSGGTDEPVVAPRPSRWTGLLLSVPSTNAAVKTLATHAQMPRNVGPQSAPRQPHCAEEEFGADAALGG